MGAPGMNKLIFYGVAAITVFAEGVPHDRMSA